MKTKKISKENKLILLLLSVMIIVGLISGTVAYFTNRQIANNIITVGHVSLETTETYEPPAKITPGISFTKTPFIKNIGNMECYVRTRILFSDESATSYASLNIDTTNWVYNADDGYYYYTPKLGVDETAIPPFTTVSISSGANIDDITAFEIYVYSEAVEAQEFATYTEAWTYFQ